IIAVAMLLLAFFQIWAVVLVAAAILGFGLGAYLAVDVAIVTLVLPSAENRAKDMGIINIANTLPHSLAPVLAGVILALAHSYSFLYIAAAIFVLLGILVCYRSRLCDNETDCPVPCVARGTGSNTFSKEERKH